MTSDEIKVDDEPNKSTTTFPNFLKFFVPSLLGVCLFLTPIVINDSVTVLVGLVSNKALELIGDLKAYFTTFIFVSAAIASAIYMLLPLSVAERTPFLKSVFRTGPVWFSLTLIGGVVSTMTFLGIGPDWVIGQDTGITAYIDVAAIIFTLIIIACIFLPLLTDYGLLEFVGTMMRGAFQRTFGLPGRATIDVLTSWVGSSSVAVIVTSRQYESGYYTAREASVIATNFSVVSIPFVLVVAQVAGVPHLFVLLYATMFVVGVICAWITPRLPPLSLIPDDYYPPVGKKINEDASNDHRPAIARGFESALARAASAPGPIQALQNGLRAAFDIAFAMMPAAMTIEFIALTAYHHTDILHIISAPMVPILNILSVPNAAEAAPGVFIGLLDQFVPAVIAGSIESDLTSFVLAGLSVTQLIFFAETALLVVRSKIPLNVLQLSMIFLIRTVIALPILALVGNLFLS